MLEIRENVDIREHCTLRVGGQFRYFLEVSEKSHINQAINWAKEKSIRVLVLGGGSNMVFPGGVLEVLAMKMKILGFEKVVERDDHVDIKIGAGEDWDSVVARAVDMSLSGIEALSAIPGTAGATPVQNVGAYGQEIADTLTSLEVFDKSAQEIKILSKSECKFGYRDSIFKNDPPTGGKDKYVILSITLRLSKKEPQMPDYPGVKSYFAEKGVSSPSLQEIREAIIYIRSNKLPDPKIVANVGSFFKNPIVPKDVADRIKSEYPKVTIFEVDSEHSKVPAGFLIEACGLKGINFGKVSVYPNNAMVLVNEGGALRSDIEHTRDEIIKAVYEKFGLKIETEPEFI
ncbi:MAG: UDP-N-acetylmuramate dehydrogenase [bacterium]